MALCSIKWSVSVLLHLQTDIQRPVTCQKVLQLSIPCQRQGETDGTTSMKAWTHWRDAVQWWTMWRSLCAESCVNCKAGTSERQLQVRVTRGTGSATIRMVWDEYEPALQSNLLLQPSTEITSNYNSLFKTYLPECRVHFKCDGTRWRTGGEVKG